LHYEGAFQVASDRVKVYEFATDPARITTVFPDVSDVSVKDPEHFTMKARVGLSFIKGMMDVRCTIPEKALFESVKLKVSASGIGSAVEMETVFRLEDAPGGGTVVRWTADAQVAGLMARVGSRLMDSAAENYVNQIVGALKLKLGPAQSG
jgi:carbon monoxide dehydrogenase subunit G